MSLRAGALLICLILIPARAFGRTWRDTLGNHVDVDFLRMHEGNVILKQKGRVIPIPFANLSETDQEYLRDQLEKKGQAHLIPEMRPAGQPGQPGASGQVLLGQQNGGAVQPGPGQQAAGQPGMPQPPVGQRPRGLRVGNPGSQMADAMARSREQREKMTQKINAQFDQMAQQMREQAEQRAQRQQQTQAQIDALRQKVRPSSPPNHQLPGQNRVLPMSLNGTTTHYCSGCKKPLGESVHAGDSCPHCGAYLQYEETATGGRVYAKWGRRGIFGLIAAVIVGLIKWVSTKS